MRLLKVMVSGLALTAVSSVTSYLVWDANAALASALIIGMITQIGTLFCAAFGYPHYGFWAD